jgi:hypothetical protein
MMKSRFALAAFATLMTIAAQGAPILPNGDFEQGDAFHPGKAEHWDAIDGLAVAWTDAPAVAGAPAHGKAIRMDTSLSEKDAVASYAKAGLTQWVFPNPAADPIAASYGISLYSEAIPVVPGKTYKVSFDFMSPQGGTGGKLWFRGYGTVEGQEKRLYEGNVDCTGGPTWQHFTGIFHPTKHTPNVTSFKIMLFAYYPPGVAWWDNIDVEMVDEPPAPPDSN